jgi:HK97 family phage portal protein
MGLIAKTLGLKAASAGPNTSVDGTYSVAPWFSQLGWGAKTSSGVTVSEDSAMGIVTVYACVRVLAESVASLPLILYRRLDGGGKERAADHQLYPLFHDSPNPEMTSFVWRETVMQHLTTWGNAYNEIYFDQNGDMQLWPMAPNRVEVKWENGARAYYFLSSKGERKELNPARMFHIPGLSANGLVGMPPIALQREALGLYQSLEAYGANTMRNSARPAAVLEHPKTLSPGAIERLATQMDQLRGSGNAGTTVVMEEGL